MKKNSTSVVVTGILLVLSLWSLWPTVQNYLKGRELAAMDEVTRADYERDNYASLVSMRENALKLGLDLQGGMHVVLEIQTDALIRDLAEGPDEAFLSVLDVARQSAGSDQSVIDAFRTAFEARDPEARLSRYFTDSEAGITRRSTNDEVVTWLKAEADEAIDRAIEIIRDRVDRFGVSEPSIAKQGDRRVVVELPGVDDPDRVRGLLKGTARLEFRLTADPEQLGRSLQNVMAYYAEADAPSADTSEVATEESSDVDEAAADTSFDLDAILGDLDETAPQNALADIFSPIGQGVIFGAALATDTARVNELLAAPAVRNLMPPNVRLMYSSSPAAVQEDGQEVFYLLGVREEVELTGDVITDARVEFDPMTNIPEVTMEMNTEGARTWARLTGANVGRTIAIVLDNVVYSYPVVNQRIVGGRSSISGLDSRAEAQDIVTILKSGALPAPLQIEEERTVGPSLGAASIRAGFTSVSIGLLIVALFMIYYYRSAGTIADLALVVNLLFVMGFLAGFKATLTLPGIAGLVLTIGMAVDANVLIFERVREEASTGKSLKAAIEGGYGKALSAIFDANITTFLVGVILYSFGVGPIQGFAVTLMAGIAASLFSAIVVTRIVFDYLVLDRHSNVAFG
jgi:preprotein translocase subunit SecD